MTDLLMECEEEELEPWQRVDQGDTFPVIENKPTDAITPPSNPMKFAIAPAGLQMPPDIPTPLMFAPSLSGPQSTSSVQATTSNYALPIKSTGVFTVPSTASVVPFSSGVSVFPINCGQLQKSTKVSSTNQTTPSFVFASQVSINQNHPTQTRKHFQMLDKVGSCISIFLNTP
uniref:Uncharacterized protein n=1 Tax=Eptatretus burgeri TaxID=7764 RepID=A0A8C4WV31_EPTBU